MSAIFQEYCYAVCKQKKNLYEKKQEGVIKTYPYKKGRYSKWLKLVRTDKPIKQQYWARIFGINET